MSNRFERARHNDATVGNMYRAGMHPTEIIATLVEQKERLKERIMELESICPKRIITSDGREMIWRCPDEFVPVTKV